MSTDDVSMIADLQKAWPELPRGLTLILPDIWDAAMIRRQSDIETEIDPINDFTAPLASMAKEAGFEHDAQGKEFIAAAMKAASVPEELHDTVAMVFSVQLHIRTE